MVWANKDNGLFASVANNPLLDLGQEQQINRDASVAQIQWILNPLNPLNPLFLL